MHTTLKLKQSVGKLVWILLLFIPQIIHADNNQTEIPVATEILPVMPVVHVEATRIAPTTGMTIIDKEMIDNLPTGNGSVNEIIGIVPGVQYGETSFNSFTGGETAPPVVSISGSRFYDNNYTIDSVSNNNPLDPASKTVSDANKLPSHPQVHFLNPQLIDQVTVYNSNIPAELGGFTGGQVDVLTVDPTTELRGTIKYRTTSDNWTKFHIDPLMQDDFNNSNTYAMQPNFRKDEFGFLFNLPLNMNTGLITSYQQLHAKIPLRHFDGKDIQTRKQENFFLKLNHYLKDDSQISLTALYSPTSSSYFLKNVKDSNFTFRNRNYSIMLRYKKEFNPGKLNLTFGYLNQHSRRRSADNRYHWNPSTASIDWRGGKKGGLGSIETRQNELSIKADFLLDTFSCGESDHQVKFGAAATHSRQNYHRQTPGIFYYRPVLDNSVTCAPNDPACIDNEQYLSRRTVYNKADSTAEVVDYAAYIQDAIIWKRVEIFPGIRVSYDDVTENFNIAPRFSASLDLSGNRNTILFAGLNRYYSGTLLTQSLYRTIITENQRRTTPGNSAADWSSLISFRYQDGKLETPYTDEITAGLIQQIFGGEFKAQYIKKKSRDEFARHKINRPSPGPDVYVLNNNGRSEHESYIFSWQRSWKNHFFEINSTWQKTFSSNTNYDTTLSEEDMTETIWYKGDELYPDEIPRRDFNRPVVANLVYRCQLPHGISLTNITRYRGAYWRLWPDRDENGHLIRQQSLVHPEQGEVLVYKKVKSHWTMTFDWNVSWKVPNSSDRNIVLTLDILNLLNHKTKIGYQTGDYGYNYELGRQIWAGLEFNF